MLDQLGETGVLKTEKAHSGVHCTNTDLIVAIKEKGVGFPLFSSIDRQRCQWVFC